MNFRTINVLVAWLVLLAVWSGCARTLDHAKALQSLKARAEQQLIQEARHALSQDRFQESSRLLERLIAYHPRSSLRDEARWSLAWSYQQAGDQWKALHHYRTLGKSGREHTYRERAKQRVLELEEKLGFLSSQQGPVRGLLVSPKALQDSPSIERLLAEAPPAGVTTYVLEYGCREADESNGSAHRWKALIHDVVNPFVTRAHSHRRTVLAAVSLRCMGRGQPKDEWRDGVYDPVSMQIHRSRFFDLFHPGYQNHVIELLGTLAQTGLDGFVFRADPPLGPLDGLTRSSIHSFEEAFQMPLHPQSLFNIHDAHQALRLKQGTVKLVSDREIFAPLFWRWSGWKTRERLRVMTDLATRLNAQYPHLKFGIEVHRLSVSNPILALMKYSEDWVEIGKSRFDFFLTKLEDADVPIAQPVDQRLRPSAMSQGQTVVEHMSQFLGDSQKLWVLSSGREWEPPIGDGMPKEHRGWRLPDGIGRISDHLHRGQ